MKNFIATVLFVLLGGVLGGHALDARADVWAKFGSSTGVLKGSATSFQTSAAVAADITSLFSCVADTSHFINGAGTCTVPAGVAPSGAANLVYATPNGSSGAATLRALVGADVPPINLGSTANGGVSSATILLGTNGGTSNGFFSVTGPATALRTFTFPNASATVLTDNTSVTVAQGGTGTNTLTNHGVLVGSGTSAVSAVAAMAADTVLMGQGASANPSAVAVNNCGDSTHAISYNTATHAWGCQAITSGGTGTVTNVASGTGLSGGPITSTGTLSVDQSFSPTWTGTHTFTPSGTSPLTINHNSGASNDFTITGGGAGAVRGTVINTTNSNGAYAGWDLGDSNGALFVAHIFPPATASAPWTGGPTGEQMQLGSANSIPLSLGTAGTERIRIVGGGAVTINAPTGGTSALTVTGTSSASVFTQVIQSGVTAGQGQGLRVFAGTNASDNAVAISNATGSSNLFLIHGDGQLFVPLLASATSAQTGFVCYLSSNGQFTYDPTNTCLLSSIRYKELVISLDTGLQDVMRLRPVSYQLKPEYNPANIGRQIGFIAEEVEKIEPRLVALDQEGKPRSVEYAQMSALLVNAIQQQQSEIQHLRAGIIFVLLVGMISILLQIKRTPRGIH